MLFEHTFTLKVLSKEQDSAAVEDGLSSVLLQNGFDGHALVFSARQEHFERRDDQSDFMQYKTITEFCLLRSIQLPKWKSPWRLVKIPVVGQINALNSFRGITVATNGVLVAIEDEYQHVRFGHLDWFVKDKDQPDSDLDDCVESCKCNRELAQEKKTKKVKLPEWIKYLLNENPTTTNK